ncbi:M10 family metallopeptidase C-terminal domain-containing protein [Gemmobacter serpentinus]|uniref:M10 family metallopeptidase C-terminal domain-containing protein n=1 Tax=Gemmobacter serpentinus TaxID=2652247 RepID=UPI00124D860A|nr:M10 family metallopeptidase C-terminal domain-containing protein [Gemmobacter serpentinus]
MKNIALPHFTIDQIARQLTDDFWTYQGETRRVFHLGADKALTYDLGTLSPDERFLARNALQAWSAASGIRFVEVGLDVRAPIVVESRDLPASRQTLQDLAVNSVFEGRLNGSQDEDWLRITLKAGQTYTITVDGVGADGLRDPYLAIYDAKSGDPIRWDDDGGNGNHSALTFTAGRSGTFYLAVGSATDGLDGGYRATFRQGRAAELTFTNDHPEDGAWSTSEVMRGRITSSLINVESDWNDAPVSLNSYWFQTYIHEVGHALGLGHGGHYNGDADWPDDAHYAEDSVMMTIMSYFFQSGDRSQVNPNFRGDAGYVVTPMAADITAIRDLYGLKASTHKGDTTYGHNSNVGGYLERLFDAMFDDRPSPGRVWQDNNILFTIHDSSGYDRLDFSTVGKNQVIRLEPGSFSSVGGFRQNMGIAEGTVIEAAIAGRGHDKIYGSDRDNHLSGGPGRDTLQGGGGNDTLVGGRGNDRLIGGSGRDLADYSDERANIVVDLVSGRAQVGGRNGSRDTILGIEDLRGGGGNDLLKGDLRNNTLQGFGGHDTLRGNAGNDILQGGRGNDLLSGGPGNDILRGGAGADRFVFDGGLDRITDFNAREKDRIEIDSDLWGGGRRSVQSLLDAANVTSSGIALSFGRDKLLSIDGVEAVAELQGHVFII